MTDLHTLPCGCQWPIVGPPPRPGALPLLEVDMEHLPFCQATWDLLATGRTKGIFQLESPLGRQWTRRLRPRHAEHLSALGAILRPGSLKALDEEGVSMTEHYCRRANGEEEPDPLHPALEDILRDTFSVLIYQEQSMRIGRELAAFTLSEVDALRKAVGKKLQKEMAKVRDLFYARAKQAGIIDESTAQKIWGWIEKSGRYAFNHCVSGDTIIRRAARNKHSRGDGFTVEELYLIKNDAQYARATNHFELYRAMKYQQCYGSGLSLQADGRIRKNVIREITQAGVRPVLRITLEDGKTIRVTDNHKFPSPEGERTTSELRPGDLLFVCGDYEKTDNRQYKFSDFTNEDRAKQAGTSGTGVFGQANRWYTNGSFTLFAQARESLPRSCALCGKTTGRLEVHHRNGNRADSHAENLMRLCASCHKKAEYAQGRTKRGEKGYPALVAPIRSIEPDGDCMTYDVTMDAPYQNFVVGSGIVTSNSHALTYGLLAYDTAYTKAHFPLVFFASWLRHARGDSKHLEEVAELVEDARLFDIPIDPPDLASKQVQTWTDGERVIFGMGDVKGMGPSTTRELLALITTQEEASGRGVGEWSWIEVLAWLGARAGDLATLIKVGGCGRWGANRSRQFHELSVVSQLSPGERKWLGKHAGDPPDAEPEFFGSPEEDPLLRLIRRLGRSRKEGGGCANAGRVHFVQHLCESLRSPPTLLVDAPWWRAAQEEQLLGIALTCSKVESCDRSEVNGTCKEFLEGAPTPILLAVVVKSVLERRYQKGENRGARFGRCALTDATATIDDAVCWHEDWARYKGLLTPGNTVLIQGGRNPRTDSLVIQRVQQI